MTHRHTKLQPQARHNCYRILRCDHVTFKPAALSAKLLETDSATKLNDGLISDLLYDFVIIGDRFNCNVDRVLLTKLNEINYCQI